MKPEPSLLGQMGLSIGGESIPFAMQAEASRMTIDEAVASGLFDMPDEPGMVRIPISLNVMIPNHLLWPPEPAAGHDPAYSPNGVPPQAPGSPLHRRFGNYPKGIAAQRVIESFRKDPYLIATMQLPAGNAEDTFTPEVLAGADGLPSHLTAALTGVRGQGERRRPDLNAFGIGNFSAGEQATDWRAAYLANVADPDEPTGSDPTSVEELPAHRTVQTFGNGTGPTRSQSPGNSPGGEVTAEAGPMPIAALRGDDSARYPHGRNVADHFGPDSHGLVTANRPHVDADVLNGLMLAALMATDVYAPEMKLVDPALYRLFEEAKEAQERIALEARKAKAAGGKSRIQSRPENAPTGTKPINKVGLSKEDLHDVKHDVQRSPDDWVGIAPNGDVIVSDIDGNTENYGPVDTFTNKPTGLVK